MTKFSVCYEWSHAQGHYRFFMIEICRVIDLNARNSRQIRRSTSTTL